MAATETLPRKQARAGVGVSRSAAGSAHRSRRDSTSSVESDVSYFYGDESDPENIVRSRHMMLVRDPDSEAIRDEMMTDGIPEFHDGPIATECNGVNDIIITGEVRCWISCGIVPRSHYAPSADTPSPRRCMAPFPLLRPCP